MNRMASTSMVLGLLVFSSPVLAYSDPSAFTDDALIGGGQGRMFTGSPRDGFTCEVCHSGGRKLNVAVQSFPATYAPNQTYEIVLLFSGMAPKVGGAIEITDRMGRGVGTLVAPGPDEVQAEDQCADFPVPAVSVTPLDDGREVVGLAACGATRLRFQWTAPSLPLGPLNFTGAIVNGDGAMTQPNPEVEGDVLNDGVTLISRKMLPVGGSAPGDVVAGGCKVTPAASGGGVGTLSLLLCGLACMRLNRRARRRR